MNIVDLIVALILGVVIFILRLIAFSFVNRKYKGKKSTITSMEIKYLKNRFKFKDNLNKWYVYILVSLSDALVFSISLFASLLLSSNIYVELGIGIVFLIILIVLLNEILGRILILKGVK